MRSWLTKIDNTAPANTGILAADEDNIRGAELDNAVTASGIALDVYGGPDTRQNMLAESMTRHASGGIFATDGGSANAYVLSITGAFVAPTALFKGLRVAFYAAATNTGASTLNAFGLGAKKFLTHTGAAMVGGEVLTSQEIEADYDPTLDGGTGAWRICPWANALTRANANGNGGASVVNVGASTGEGTTVGGSTPYPVNMNYPGLSSGSPVSSDLLAFYAQTAVSGQTRHRSITWSALLDLLRPILTVTAPRFAYGDVGSVFVAMNVTPYDVGTSRTKANYSGVGLPGPDNGVWLVTSSRVFANGSGGASSGDQYETFISMLRTS